MNWLRRVVEEEDTLLGRLFTYFVQLLILGSLISIGVETLPDLPPEARGYLQQFESFTVAVFVVEYLLRLLVAKRKLRFVFSFLALIDLAAVLPFLLVTGLDLRSLRAFRMLRLFRVFKLMRYNNAAKRFRRALSLAREELTLFFIVSLLIVFVSAVGIYYCERSVQPEAFRSVFHSLWWAVATLTTVGYVDAYPETVAGQVMTFFILMLGPGFLVVPSGLMASALSEARHLERMEAARGKVKPFEDDCPSHAIVRDCAHSAA
jgi:voltage-gated potassium channel